MKANRRPPSKDKAKVVLDITMSVDGYVAGPNVDAQRPLGEGGERLHDWAFGGKPDNRLPIGHYPKAATDADVLAEMFTTTGAFVMGKRTFDVGEEPWGDEPPFRVPCFVLTHDARERLVKGETTFTFITDGIDNALKQAKAVAGDKNVTVMGGASTAQQYLKVGLIEEMSIHVVPVLLGDGARLFDNTNGRQTKYECVRVVSSLSVSHYKYRLRRRPIRG